MTTLGSVALWPRPMIAQRKTAQTMADIFISYKQPTRLDRDQQHETRTLRCRLPERCMATSTPGWRRATMPRALNVAAFNSLRGFGHHDGTSPHRMRTKSRLPSRSVTTSTGSVGQILYLGGRLCGGALIVSR